MELALNTPENTSLKNNFKNKLRETPKLLVEKLKQSNKLLLFCVVIPTTMAILYYGLIASDVYVSESRFVVRNLEKPAIGGLSSLLMGAGFSSAQDEAYIVHDYILSSDALQQLENELQIKTHYSNNQIDIFDRFGFLPWQTSFVDFLNYFQKKVDISSDSSSSISTLTVHAYSSEEAYLINKKLLTLSEALINRLNERGRQDMLRFAQAELLQAKENNKIAALELLHYRKKKKIFDPLKQSMAKLQFIAKLQAELVAIKTQLVLVKKLTPINPQVSVLEQRVRSVQKNIQMQMAKVTGEGSSFSNRSIAYERLQINSAFAKKQLQSAFISLEKARIEAARKQVYLERIIQPSKPDRAVEPRRLRGMILVLVLGLIFWGVLSMILTGIKEHHN